MEIKDNRSLFKKRDIEEKQKQLHLIVCEGDTSRLAYLDSIEQFMQKHKLDYHRCSSFQKPLIDDLNVLQLVQSRIDWYMLEVKPWLDKNYVVLVDSYYQTEMALPLLIQTQQHFAAIRAQMQAEQNALNPKMQKKQPRQVEISLKPSRDVEKMCCACMKQPDILFTFFNLADTRNELAYKTYNELFRLGKTTIAINTAYAFEVVSREVTTRLSQFFEV